MAVKLVGNRAEVRVQDSGMGIKREFLPHVFERFRQADGSTTRVHGGLGLGLSIVRNLVELHGGSVAAQSEGEGKGAVFTVHLPVLQVDRFMRHPEEFARLEDPAMEASESLAGMVLLIVDDEPDGRALLGRLLSDAGATVREADSAQAGLEWLSRGEVM